MVLLVFILLLLLLVAIFALKNSQLVIVDLFFDKIEMSQAVLILSCVAIGILFMLIIYAVHRIRASRKIKALEKELNTTKDELERARARVAVVESELRTGTSKTLEESILDNRVTGFEADEVIVAKEVEDPKNQDTELGAKIIKPEAIKEEKLDDNNRI